MFFSKHNHTKRHNGRNQKGERKPQIQNESNETMISKKSNPVSLEDRPPALPPRRHVANYQQLRDCMSTPNLINQPSNLNEQRSQYDHIQLKILHERKHNVLSDQTTALSGQIIDQVDNAFAIMDREDAQASSQLAKDAELPMKHPTVPVRRNLKAWKPFDRDLLKLPSSSQFSKVWAYANARLPLSLPSIKLYLDTYPLLSLAATHSLSVYTPPQRHPARATSIISTTHHTPSSFLTGAKAMTISTATHDSSTSPVVIVAIRGSATFMDWAVNARQAPTPPTEWLDDEGNLCHAGFLAVARSMADRVAAQLRDLLLEKPGRRKASIVFTGHSAGGAIATLLYMHCLSNHSSNLISASHRFKRVHCITFGVPPVSLLPLQKPFGQDDKRIRKSLFFGFVNEGDPVVRAEKAYVKSLLCLYTAPVSKSPAGERQPVWPVPPGVLSCAGRLVLLRPKKCSYDERMEDIEACIITDEELRGIVFGDVQMHAMKVYAMRIERIAIDAVTANGVRT